MKKKSREETGLPSGIELHGELLTRATDLPRKIPVGVPAQLDRGLLTTDRGTYICKAVQAVGDTSKAGILSSAPFIDILIYSLAGPKKMRGSVLMSTTENTPMDPHEGGNEGDSRGLANEHSGSVNMGTGDDGTGGKNSKRKLWMIGAVGVFVALVGFIVWVVAVPSTDDNYWESLQSQGLNGEYLNREIAVAQGQGFCEQVAAGQTTEAVWFQKTAVDFYCPEFSEAIELVPTEEEEEAAYLSDLRSAELGGEFASDAAAISSGRAVCTRLDGGGKSQGPTTELIAVKNFCSDYAGGFRELSTFKVVGTFTLYDEDYLCIAGGLALSGGYDDIGAGTDVKWDNQDGDRLATTTLGEDTVRGSDSCEWTFTSELPEGEERYLLGVGRRGTQEFTEAELKVPGAVGLSLGSPF